MIFKKLVHFIVQKSLGQELSMAFILLQSILAALENHDVSDLARVVFTQLPEGWRQPNGPATETEFVDMVQAGQLFLDKVKAVMKP